MKEILLAACGAWVLVNIIQLHLLIKVNRKPLSCHTCLAGWLTLLLTFQDYYWLHIPFMMSASMMIVIFFNYIMKRLF